MNGRFFPQNWRPALQEIAFAAANGFAAVQWRGPLEGLGEQHLGAPLAVVAAELERTNVQAVMEILIPVNAAGYTLLGATPLAALQANLSAINVFKMTAVHWHLVPERTLSVAECRQLEEMLRPQLAQAVALGQRYGFRFGIEHNEPTIGLFGLPEVCAAALDAVDGLWFVWDFNHTVPDYFVAFAGLAPRVSMLHISDTMLPAVNHHLPLGMGNLDMRPFIKVLEEVGFEGVGILEIGGLPASGGYGRDTDEALIDSRERWLALL